MGTDIEGHFEIKLNEKWEHYDKLKISRCYDLFFKMAGVRPELEPTITPISQPKGAPGDISPTTQLEMETIGGDGYSYSYLNAKEIQEVIDWYGKYCQKQGYKMETIHRLDIEWGCLFGGGWNKFLNYREDYPKEIQDIRLVFWFD